VAAPFVRDIYEVFVTFTEFIERDLLGSRENDQSSRMRANDDALGYFVLSSAVLAASVTC
jgi:hypothetical protein